MNIVTGASGFLGGVITRKLASDNQHVKALYRDVNSIPQDLLNNANISWIKGDVLDTEALLQLFSEGDQVYNCAALVSFNPAHAKQLAQVNIKGTENIVNVSIHKKIKKLIHISSIAALGRSKSINTINEDTEWEDDKLNSAYAISKYEGEMMVWRGIAEGLCADIINPGIILGPTNWNRGSGNLFKKVANGLAFYPPGASAFIGVNDVADMSIQLMNSNIHSQRYVCIAENLSYLQLFTWMAEGLHKKPPHIQVGAFVSNMLALVESIRIKFTGGEPIITKETIRSAQENFVYLNDKSIAQLGFNYTPIKQVILDACSHYPRPISIDHTAYK